MILISQKIHTRVPNTLKEEEEEQGKNVSGILSSWEPLETCECRRLKDMVIQG